MRRKLQKAASTLSVALLTLWGVSCEAAPRYTITDLGPGVASAINSQSQVVGTSNSYYRFGHAVLWQKKTVRDLGPAGSQTYAINDKGQVVGMCAGRAVLWQDGRMTELGALPPPSADYLPAHQSGATGINNAGQIAGYSVFRLRPGLPAYPQSVDFPYAFLWQHGHMTSLGLQNGALTTTINAAGKINFFVPVRSPVGSHLGGITGLNDKNQVIGTISLGLVTKSGRNMKTHAFLSVSGRARDLGTLGGSNSTPHAINNSADVVGESDLAGKTLHAAAAHGRSSRYVLDQESHAFLWRAGKMWDLNRLLPARSGWVLLSANGLNNRGQVVGDGLYRNHHHAFLLTPE